MDSTLIYCRNNGVFVSYRDDSLAQFCVSIVQYVIGKENNFPEVTFLDDFGWNYSNYGVTMVDVVWYPTPP